MHCCRCKAKAESVASQYRRAPSSSVHANYCLLQITDVTVAVTRERVLRERQNARYHAIVDSAPDAIITVDDNHIIQWVNGAVDHILGYTLRILGQNLDLLLERDNPLLRALSKTSADQKTEAAISVVGRYKNGKSGHFDVSVGRWRADQRDFVTTIWRDVTERVAADAALREARDALTKKQRGAGNPRGRANPRARDALRQVARIPEDGEHRPIDRRRGARLQQSVGGYPRQSGPIEKGGAQRSSSVQIARSRNSGRGTWRYVDRSALAFARRQELKVEFVELQKLIPEMLDFLRHSVGPSVVIHAEVSPEVSAVEVDANQLELALINLAVNARDAMPKVERSLSPVKTRGGKRTGLPPNPFVCISVTDTGEGMSEATLARAQEPFFTTKGVGKGTGLGLSMVQGFTAQSGGAMRIKSEPGEGHKVTLWLPRAKERSEKRSKEDRSIPSSRSEKLACVAGG